MYSRLPGDSAALISPFSEAGISQTIIRTVPFLGADSPPCCCWHQTSPSPPALCKTSLGAGPRLGCVCQHENLKHPLQWTSSTEGRSHSPVSPPGADPQPCKPMCQTRLGNRLQAAGKLRKAFLLLGKEGCCVEFMLYLCCRSGDS